MSYPPPPPPIYISSGILWQKQLRKKVKEGNLQIAHKQFEGHNILGPHVALTALISVPSKNKTKLKELPHPPHI